nr:sugar ABC transporter permease [Paenibacillus sp. VKM B-2647]
MDKRRYRYDKNELFWAYLMIAPTMLGLALFYVWPVLQTFFYTFTKWGAFNNYQLTGFDNYKHLLTDQNLLKAFRNTFLFIALSVPISIFLSIVVAVLLNQKVRGLSVYRTIYYLPVVTMPAAIAMVWKWLYNADYGLINYLLSLVHIRGPQWLTDPRIAMYSVIVVAIWSSIGSNMIIFLSGLQGISSTYYEAASIDGASPLRKFWMITLPLLTPTVFFVAVVSLIGGFQVFDLIFMMVVGSSAGTATTPAIDTTQTVVYLFYRYAFMLNNKGYAATVAMVLFVIILAVTYVQMKLQKNGFTTNRRLVGWLLALMAPGAGRRHYSFTSF